MRTQQKIYTHPAKEAVQAKIKDLKLENKNYLQQNKILKASLQELNDKAPFSNEAAAMQKMAILYKIKANELLIGANKLNAAETYSQYKNYLK